MLATGQPASLNTKLSLDIFALSIGPTSKMSSEGTLCLSTLKLQLLIHWRPPPTSKVNGRSMTIWTNSDLIEDSGYTDPKTIVVKFRRGLDCRISTALAGMATGRPSDTKLEAWFHLAIQIDQNHAAD